MVNIIFSKKFSKNLITKNQKPIMERKFKQENNNTFRQNIAHKNYQQIQVKNFTNILTQKYESGF